MRKSVRSEQLSKETLSTIVALKNSPSIEQSIDKHPVKTVKAQIGNAVGNTVPSSSGNTLEGVTTRSRDYRLKSMSVIAPTSAGHPSNNQGDEIVCSCRKLQESEIKSSLITLRKFAYPIISMVSENLNYGVAA